MNNIDQSVQDKLIELETKITFQDDVIEKLNEIVSQQQFQLYELNKKFSEILSQEATKNNIKDIHLETPPPHY